MGLTHSPSIIMNNLVGYWDAANKKSYPGSGTSWTDLSGNGNHITLVNSPTYATTNGGNFNFAFASSQYGTINSTTGFPFGASAGSLACWATMASIRATWAWVIAYGSGNTSQARFLGVNNAVYYFGGYANDISGSTATLNTWFHMTGVYTGTTASFYINGNLIAGPTAKTWNTVSNLARIGQQVNAAGEYWDGRIANISVYSKALSQSEITQNFNAHRGRFNL